MSLKRKILLFFGSLLALITIVLTVLYFWVTTHAVSLLTKLVDEQSQGKLQLTVKSIDFNLFKLQILITQPELKTKDSINIPSGYHVSVKNMTFRFHALFSYILHKQLMFDSIIINSPEINVFKYKEVLKKKISITEEVDKVYESLESALKVVQLDYLHIDSAKFNIYDRTQTGSSPLQISNLNLTINQASSRKKNSTDNRFLFTDRILLEIFNQDIQLKGGLQGIKFKRLRLSTGSRTIKLDSCILYGKKTDTAYNALDISFDAINISNLDFNTLVKSDVLKLDSALLVNPHIKLRLAINEKTGKSGLIKNVPGNKDSLILIFKKLLGNIDIGYLAMHDASINLESKKDNKISNYSADKIDFDIRSLVIIDDPAIPIHLGDLELAVRNYTAYKLDSLSAVKFDSIKLIKNKIILANFSLVTTKDNPQLVNSTIKTKAFELTDIKWPELIYDRRLIAGTASLINPEVNLILPAKGKKPKPLKGNPFLKLSTLKDQIQLKNFFIVDGTVNIKTATGVSVSADHFFADIKARELLKENSLKNSLYAVDNLSFSEGSFNNKDLQLLVKGVSYSNMNKTFKLGEVKQTKTDQSIAMSLKKVELEGFDINEESNFSVSNLMWSKADININKKQKSGEEKSNTTKKADFKVIVSHTTGGSTHFTFNTDKITASTQINKISADEIILAAGEKPVINSLQIDGQPFLVNQKNTESNIAAFNISDKNKSSLQNVTLRLRGADKTVRIFLPELVFSTDINKDINGMITADFIELNKPVISFEPGTGLVETKQERTKGKLPLIQIGTLKINEPTIENLPDNLAKKMQVSAGIAEFTVKGIYSDKEAIRLDSVLATFKNPDFKNDKIKLVPTGKEFIRMAASDLTFSPWADSSEEKWAFTLKSVRASNFLIHTYQADTIRQNIALNSLDLEHTTLNSVSIKNYKELLKSNDRFLVANGDIVLDNGKSIIAINNLQLDRAKNKLSLDSFSFHPVLDRDSFMKTKKYQLDYAQLKAGKILVNDINFDQLVNDTAFVAKKITLNSTYLSLFRDKRLPFQYGIEKPMLTELISRIKLKMNIDTVLIRTGRLQYEEVNDKTLLLGKVKLEDIRGNVTGFKNFNFSPDDSLRFTLSTKIMDAATTKVKYAQSYTDSLSSFLIRVNISPFDLKALNPFLEPLVSAKVRSGFLDTVSMSAMGRKSVAWGKMKMYYHDLDFQYLDKGSTAKKTLKTKLITFFGNLVVHTNNRTGTGNIYVERLTEKGFPNYWIKILLSGALTNTGIRTNKKAEKKYYKGIKKFDVPPITEISID